MKISKKQNAFEYWIYQIKMFDPFLNLCENPGLKSWNKFSFDRLFEVRAWFDLLKSVYREKNPIKTKFLHLSPPLFPLFESATVELKKIKKQFSQMVFRIMFFTTKSSIC